MALSINSTKDVYKFAVTLYDYLGVHGQSALAHGLSDVVDDCFSSSNEAIQAYKKAFWDLKNKGADLPPDYQMALDKSLELLH